MAYASSAELVCSPRSAATSSDASANEAQCAYLQAASDSEVRPNADIYVALQGSLHNIFSLSLVNTYVGDAGVVTLGQALHTLPNLVVLDLRNNGASNACCPDLMVSCLQSRRLAILDVGGNKLITRQGGGDLLKLASRHVTLLHINTDGTLVSRYFESRIEGHCLRRKHAFFRGGKIDTQHTQHPNTNPNSNPDCDAEEGDVKEEGTLSAWEEVIRSHDYSDFAEAQVRPSILRRYGIAFAVRREQGGGGGGVIPSGGALFGRQPDPAAVCHPTLSGMGGFALGGGGGVAAEGAAGQKGGGAQAMPPLRRQDSVGDFFARFPSDGSIGVSGRGVAPPPSQNAASSSSSSTATTTTAPHPPSEDSAAGSSGRRFSRTASGSSSSIGLPRPRPLCGGAEVVGGGGGGGPEVLEGGHTTTTPTPPPVAAAGAAAAASAARSSVSNLPHDEVWPAGGGAAPSGGLEGAAAGGGGAAGCGANAAHPPPPAPPSAARPPAGAAAAARPPPPTPPRSAGGVARVPVVVGSPQVVGGSEGLAPATPPAETGGGGGVAGDAFPAAPAPPPPPPPPAEAAPCQSHREGVASTTSAAVPAPPPAGQPFRATAPAGLCVDLSGGGGGGVPLLSPSATSPAAMRASPSGGIEEAGAGARQALLRHTAPSPGGRAAPPAGGVGAGLQGQQQSPPLPHAVAGFCETGPAVPPDGRGPAAAAASVSAVPHPRTPTAISTSASTAASTPVGAEAASVLRVSDPAQISPPPEPHPKHATEEGGEERLEAEHASTPAAAAAAAPPPSSSSASSSDGSIVSPSGCRGSAEALARGGGAQTLRCLDGALLGVAPAEEAEAEADEGCTAGERRVTDADLEGLFDMVAAFTPREVDLPTTFKFPGKLHYLPAVGAPDALLNPEAPGWAPCAAGTLPPVGEVAGRVASPEEGVAPGPPSGVSPPGEGAGSMFSSFFASSDPRSLRVPLKHANPNADLEAAQRQLQTSIHAANISLPAAYQAAVDALAENSSGGMSVMPAAATAAPAELTSPQAPADRVSEEEEEEEGLSPRGETSYHDGLRHASDGRCFNTATAMMTVQIAGGGGQRSRWEGGAEAEEAEEDDDEEEEGNAVASLGGGAGMGVGRADASEMQLPSPSTPSSGSAADRSTTPASRGVVAVDSRGESPGGGGGGGGGDHAAAELFFSDPASQGGGGGVSAGQAGVRKTLQQYLRQCSLDINPVRAVPQGLTQQDYNNWYTLENVVDMRGGARLTSGSLNGDGSLLATGSYDLTAKVWRAESGELLHTLAGHSGYVYDVIWNHPFCDRVVTASFDRTCRVWDVETGESLHTLSGHELEVVCVTINSASTLIASGSMDQVIIVWNALNGTQVATLQGHSAEIVCLDFSPKGDLLVSGSADEAVRVWHALTGECLAHLEGHRGEVSAVRFNVHGNTVLSCSADTTCRLWDVHTSKGKVLKGHSKDVSDCEFSSDGWLVASGSEDMSARVWDALSGGCIAMMKGHVAGVCCVSFNAASTELLTGSADMRCFRWRVSTGECLQVLTGHLGVVISSYSTDNGTILTISKDNTCRVFRKAQQNASLVFYTLRHICLNPAMKAAVYDQWDRVPLSLRLRLAGIERSLAGNDTAAA